MSKALSAKAGDVLNKIAIRVVFDPYFTQVLIPNYLRQLPRGQRTDVPTFEVLNPLPQPGTYRQIRDAHFTTTVGDLISGAQAEVESLGQELRDWHDNLPDGLNTSAKADEIQEAASTLEAIDFPDVPDDAENLPAVHLPSLDLSSRPKRATEVCAMLDMAIQVLTDHAQSIQEDSTEQKPSEEQQDKAGSPAPKGGNESEAVDPATFTGLAEELENIKSEVEGVSFPSMM